MFTACAAADDGGTGETVASEEEAEEQIETTEQAATQSCHWRSHSRYKGCYSKFCPSGYYAAACSGDYIKCCRPY